MSLWTVRLVLKTPAEVEPRTYARRIEDIVKDGVIERGTVLPSRIPGGRTNVALYTIMEAPTAADSLVLVGDALREGLGVEEADIIDARARVAVTTDDLNRGRL